MHLSIPNHSIDLAPALFYFPDKLLFFQQFSLPMEVLYEYLATGIVNSGIRQFGGDECHAEIPPLYHWTVSIFFGVLSLILAFLWKDSLAKGEAKRRQMEAGWGQRLCFWSGLISLLLTLYCKLETRRGLFILNPCHIALIMLLVLLAAKDNTSLLMRRLHMAWTAWLFCPFSALVLPHLQKISVLQFLLYYIEHLIILPLGPLVLYRRYGNPWPSLKGHIAGFGTIVAFQMFLLVPIGRFLRVNLNFALCHSPDEPFFPSFGYHYIVMEIFNLCIIAYFIHLATSLYVWGYYKALKKIFGKEQKKQ